ncbi:hypothetical protein FS749_009058 [Ceratobasidium sp. UAMH 11750]|nr:hypothetical protein FS749_009058 [Ceratobasidium sp. UAMH 11750]
MGYYDEHPSSYSRDYREVGDRVGLGLIGLAGLSSAVSTFCLLVYLVWHSFFSKDETSPLVRGLQSFSRSALGVFLYSLLVSDLIQGSAFAINLKWAADGGIQHSATCTVQAAVSQFGDLGGALWSLAIAYHTFSLLFLLSKPSIWATCSLLGVGWTLITVLPILGPTVIENVAKRGHFYGISGAWCWIGDDYQAERFIYVYMWIFLSLLSSLVLYSLVYLRFSGFLFYEQGKLVWKPTSRANSRNTMTFNVSGESNGTNGTRLVGNGEFNGVGKHLKKVARRLMFYPLVYSLVTVPVAVCRLMAISGWKVPFPLYAFAGTTFASSGLTNVILFIITRHSFIQQVASIQTRIHVTQQVTVLEDTRGGQSIYMHNMSASRIDDQEASYFKVGDLKADVVMTPTRSTLEVPRSPSRMSQSTGESGSTAEAPRGTLEVPRSPVVAVAREVET